IAELARSAVPGQLEVHGRELLVAGEREIRALVAAHAQALAGRDTHLQPAVRAPGHGDDERLAPDPRARARASFAAASLRFRPQSSENGLSVWSGSAMPPMMTVGHPCAMWPSWSVSSPMRAAGFPPMSTVGSPLLMTSWPGRHSSVSPTRAA